MFTSSRVAEGDGVRLVAADREDAEAEADGLSSASAFLALWGLSRESSTVASVRGGV